MLLLLAGAARAAPPPPAATLTLDELGLNQKHFNPERGEVTLERLHKGQVPSGPRLGLKLDPHLSIFVTDVETVSQIKFSQVMDNLVHEANHSGDKSLNKLTLFRQWWDSAGQGAGLALGPHCDDRSDAQPASGIADHTAVSTLHGFPYRCPRLEAAEAASDPFTDESDGNPNAYSAIAFSNRFDLIGAPVDVTNPGSGQTRKEWPDCGEYRIVFARNSGKTDPLNRNLIIFEARVSNPRPAASDPSNPSDPGPVGCRPILEFWHSLSNRSLSATERGIRLRKFYLEGQLETGKLRSPVVSVANYTFGAGQIRTNQFMLNDAAGTPKDWVLREFKTRAVNGTVVIAPDSVKSNPGSSLFAEGSTDIRIGALVQNIRVQLPNLLGAAGPALGPADVNSIGFSTKGEGVNSFESDEHDATLGSPSLGDISVAFVGASGKPNPTISQNIQTLLAINQSSLTPLNVISRLKTQTCAGCHHFSDPTPGTKNSNVDLGGGAVWPAKAQGDVGHPTNGLTHPGMDFTQESERTTDQQPAIIGSGKRYATSLTVETFLVFREQFMKRALGLP